jgi:hypothetical protein
MPQPGSASSAEARAREYVEEMRTLTDSVAVHIRREHLAEQLSFLQARDNFRAFRLLIEQRHDTAASTLARTLFEEAMRWAWVDEDWEERRPSFFGEAHRAYSLIADAAAEQGIDADMFFGPLVGESLLPEASGAKRFPRRFEELMDWMPDTRMHYLQYRLLSQYVHSSLLAAASTTTIGGGGLSSTGALPRPARLTAIRNAVASMAVILDFTKAGLRWPPGSALNVVAFGVAHRVAAITYPHAPASR